MLYSKFNNKHISIWQHLSFALSEAMVFSTIVISVLQSIDTHFNCFHNGTFMFDYLDMYCKIHSLILFDFGVMVSSMAPEFAGLNITTTLISVLMCIVLGYFLSYIYKPKAKPILVVWLIILIMELLFSFVFANSPLTFCLFFVVRVFLLLCVIFSLRYVNNNYEYYDM